MCNSHIYKKTIIIIFLTVAFVACAPEPLPQIESANHAEVLLKSASGLPITKHATDCEAVLSSTSINSLKPYRASVTMAGKYKLTDDGIVVVYANNQRELCIKKVATINPRAFAYKRLTHVVLPKSLVTIGAHAFRGNYLVDVVIPDSVKTIGKCAFADNHLRNIIIPASVDTIDDMAFRDNEIGKLIIPKSVKRIGNRSFIKNRLTEVILKPPMLSIGRKAFMNNNVRLVKLGSKVYELYHKKLQSIFRNNSNDHQTHYEFLDATLQYKPDTYDYSPIADDDVINNVGIYKHKSGLGTVHVSRNAQGEPTRVLHITQGTRVIPKDAFHNNKLTAVVIPNSVRVIGSYAFDWNDLKTLTIPRSVEVIGDKAFANNTLTKVDFEFDAEVGVIIGRHAFYNNTKLEILYLSDDIQSIGESAFEGCPLNGIDIPASLQKVGARAFKGHNISNIRFVPHDGPIAIGDEAFLGLYSMGTSPKFGISAVKLSNVYMPQSLFTKHQSRLAAIFGANRAGQTIRYRNTKGEKEFAR